MFRAILKVLSPQGGRQTFLERLSLGLKPSRIYSKMPMIAPTTVTYKAMSSSSSGGLGSHITQDWPLAEKAREDAWIREKEADEGPAAAVLMSQQLAGAGTGEGTGGDALPPLLPKSLTSLVEMELEDVLCNEYITPAAKEKLMQWKLKVWHCVSSVGATPPTAPSDKVAALAALDGMLRTAGLDLSDEVKSQLVAWKLKGLQAYWEEDIKAGSKGGE